MAGKGTVLYSVQIFIILEYIFHISKDDIDWWMGPASGHLVTHDSTDADYDTFHPKSRDGSVYWYRNHFNFLTTQLIWLSYNFPGLWYDNRIIIRGTSLSESQIEIHVMYQYFQPGPWFNIKMSSYQDRSSRCGDKTIRRPSYLHNMISYIDKTTSLYWLVVNERSPWWS